MPIHLFQEYFFDRDKLNWILQVETFSKKKNSNVLKNIAYFGNAKDMSRYMANMIALRTEPNVDTTTASERSISALEKLVCAIEVLSSSVHTAIADAIESSLERESAK